MPSRIQRELALAVTGKDVSATRTLRGVNREIGKLERVAGKAGTNVARNLERGLVVGAGVAAGAIGYAVKQAQDFESSSASIRKTVNGNVDAIIAANRRLAASRGFDVNDLNEISAVAGALGVEKADIASFTETVALLAVTTDDVSTEMGAMSFGHLKTTLKLTGNDFHELGDELVYLGNNGASTEGEILSMAENIAGAANTVGASKEQVLGWASAMASVGEEAEAGGSSIQRFWLGSFKAVNEGGAKLKLMAKVAGQSAAQFKEAFGKDATGTLAKFLVSLGKLSKAEQLATLKALGFTDIRITRALLALLGNTDNLTQSLTDVEHASGAMGKEAEKRFATSAQQMKILEANVRDAAITIGSELLPVVNDLAKQGVDWLQGHQDDIARFAHDLADGLRDAVTWAESLDWDAIGDSLRAGAGFAKGLVDVFMGMPPWLQEFLAVGFVANKFSGGAVTDLTALVARSVIKGVLGVNAGVVNVRGGVVNAGGLPGRAGGAAGAGAAAGGAGKLVTAMRVFGVVAIAGEALLLLKGIKDEQTERNHQLEGDFTQRTLGAALGPEATVAGLQAALDSTDRNIAKLTNDLTPEAIAFQLNVDGVRDSVINARDILATQLTKMTNTQTTEAEGIKSAIFGQGFNTTTAIDQAGHDSTTAAEKTRGAIGATTAAARSAGQATAAAIKDKDLSVTVPITTNVQVNTTINSRTTRSKLNTQHQVARPGLGPVAS